jgi:CRP-like cAMP-binding protein
MAREAIKHLIRLTPLTREEIAEHFGLNIKVVVQLLRDMQESGEIVQESVWIGGRNLQQICLGEKG